MVAPPRPGEKVKTIKPTSHAVREHYTIAGGFKTRHLEAGPAGAQSVVLLHDGAWGGSSSATWGNFIPALAENFRVIAIDMLGFGGTDKAVFLDRSPYEPRIAHVAAFLTALGIDTPVHLVGNSFGGSLALRWLADGSPGTIRSVTSINGTGGPWRTPLALAELGRWDGTRQDLRRIVELLTGEFDGIEAQLDDRLRWASEPGHYRAMTAVMVPLPEALVATRPTDNWPRQLSGKQTPTLLVKGSQDVLLEPDWTSHFEEIMPAAEVATLNCRHEPNIDNPQLLLPVLVDFLTRVDEG